MHYSCALFSYFTVAIHIFSCCTFSMLHFFHTSPFPCCTFLCSNLLILHFFSCCTLFMHCTILLFYWKNYVCQGLKLLKLGCELKLTSPRHKILSISCRYFNYDIENERTHKKYTCPEKILVLVPLFSKLLNYNYRPKEISLSNNLLKNKVLSYLFPCSRL